MATRQDIINHLQQTAQQMKAAGQDTSQIDANVAKAMAKGPQYLAQPVNLTDEHQKAIQTLSQPQQLPVGNQGGYNAPKTTSAPIDQNVSGYAQGANQAQTAQQTPPPAQQTEPQPQGYGNQDVAGLIRQAIGAGRQLNPNLLQGVGGMLSTLGGGKPYVSPAQTLGEEAAKANIQMTPYKQMLMQSQIGKNQSQQEVNKSAIGEKESTANLNNERAKGAKWGNQFLEGGQGGTDANGNPVSMQVSSVSTGRGGVTLKNMNELGQEKGMTAAVRPLETQNAKVDSGLHALRVMDQGFENGKFNIAKMNQGELNQNLAAIIAGSGPSSDARVEGVRQGSLAGTVMDKIGYLIGQPVNVVTPEIAQRLHQTLISQIRQSDTERQPYKQQLGISSFGNDPEQYFQKSPSYQYYYGGQGGQQNQQTGNSGGSPEGTVITNGSKRMIKKGGQWTPMQ